MYSHSVHELQALSLQHCPICDATLDYDDGFLHCPVCKKGWSYRDYKDDERAYKQNPKAYVEAYRLKNSNM